MLDEINLKILIIGDSSSGKTQLLLRYVDEFFPQMPFATIGVEFKCKKIKLNNLNINLLIWDTAGQERFHAITKSFIINENGLIFVYDITNRSSFRFIKEKYMYIKDIKSENVKVIIVGNNMDMEDKRQVSKETVKIFCEKYNIENIEVSSSLGTNVSKCFETLAKLIIENKSKEELLREFGRENNRNLNKIKKVSVKEVKKLKSTEIENKKEKIKNNGEDIQFPKLNKYLDF